MLGQGGEGPRERRSQRNGPTDPEEEEEEEGGAPLGLISSWLLLRFMFIMMIILTAFLCGMNNIYVHYQESSGRLGR